MLLASLATRMPDIKGFVSAGRAGATPPNTAPAPAGADSFARALGQAIADGAGLNAPVDLQRDSPRSAWRRQSCCHRAPRRRDGSCGGGSDAGRSRAGGQRRPRGARVSRTPPRLSATERVNSTDG
jgi:hypothetical protein